MERREFLFQSALFAGGGLIMGNLCSFTQSVNKQAKDLYEVFQNPDLSYHPFVRWWWNGDKLKADELIRELRLLKEAGIGGVEINPIEFPSKAEGDDLGIPSLQWLGDEWIDMLKVTFSEAQRLGITCDLIVGSGWPFGAETLPRDERAQVVLVYAKELDGPTVFETSQFNIFDTVDPEITVKEPGRTFEILSLKLVPNPMSGLRQVIELSEKKDNEVIYIEVPEGKHVLYALVKVESFASVINGAPGAAGPILDHMNPEAVRKYLDNMSDKIQDKTGPLSQYLRAFFTDSMELEGCNWSKDLTKEFYKRRGYDIMPYLPFILFKVGRLGGVVDANYGAAKTPEFREIINRVRFDFELTKAELLNDRFTQTYLKWCKDLNVKSRAQSYGRAFFPLVSSIGYDIPEGESWTTNWLKHKLGEEMSDDDYRRGRGYTMINKYVSSAAHLAGTRIVSCEEMTNTYLVFNTSLELLKIGSDMSIISGVTHSVWHGFNYSPPEAPYPGWIQYGSYYNENNTWWPYFKYLNQYKARISSLLQNTDMYTDIAILPANYDLWGEMGVQTDPFPEKLNVPYTSIIWESINKNGGAADYVTEKIIEAGEIRRGKLCYGNKMYGTLFLPEVTSISSETASKLFEFVSGGGRIFCIEKYPEKSLGLNNYKEKDKDVQGWVEKMKDYPEHFVLLEKPKDNRLLEWYEDIMERYDIPHYITIEKPNRFLMQNRYQTDDKNEIFFFCNVHLNEGYETGIVFSKEIAKGKFAWIWDAETGYRHRLKISANGNYFLKLGPAESQIIVFDKDKNGEYYEPLPIFGDAPIELGNSWDVKFKHCREEEIIHTEFDNLKDLKEIPEHYYFAGTIIYRKEIILEGKLPSYLNLGKVYGISELKINGEECGAKWYGNRVYNVSDKLRLGANIIEVSVVTTMGNYMKSLTDNPIAQKWTNKGNKDQPLQSMGLIGPVRLYN